MAANPYAVPLDELVRTARVAAEEQVTLQSEPRLQGLAGDPVTWAPGGVTGAVGGAAHCHDDD